MQNYTDFFLLKDIPQNEQNEIISAFPSSKSFKKGEIIYSAEVFPNALGLILKGEAFAVTNNDNKLFMNSFKSGTAFGVAAVFGNKSNFVSTITAKTDMEILFITEETLLKIFEKYPKTAVNYIEFLSDKIRFLNKKVALLSSGSADDTVLNYLSSVADSSGNAALPRNMTLLSKTIGISRASLYRCIENLENKGLILKENNIIKVIKNEKNS